jgi:hypothetical protein
MGPELKNMGPKIKILIYLFSKTLPQKFQRRFFSSHPLTLSPQKSHTQPSLSLSFLPAPAAASR